MRSTRIIESYYSGYSRDHLPFNYVLMRAGRISTGPEYKIKRRSLPGHEFIFCLDGKGVVTVDNLSHEVQPGQMAWLPVQFPHAHYPDAEDPWDILWWRMEGSNLDSLKATLSVVKNPVFSFSDTGSIEALFHAALKQIQIQSMSAMASFERTAATLIEHLVAVRRLSLASSQNASHKGLLRLQYEVRLHYNDEWSVERMASVCNVSKPHLFKLFNTAFGVTPQRWIRNFRMSQAKHLLVETDLPVSDIAFQIGFKDPMHFSRNFKRHFGVSPTEFRKENP